MKFTFNISLLLVSLLSFGQAQSSKAEKEKEPLEVYDIMFGFNLIPAGKTFIGSGETSQELQFALATSKANLVLDLGTEKNNRANGYVYENKGSYFRLGLDKNFIKDVESGNLLSLGLRYARANFEDELSYFSSTYFGEENITLANPGLKARWLEVSFNLRGKIVSNLYTGFTLRWKFARNVKGQGELKPFDIPGFGTTKRQNSTAFDYYLMWRIPFK